MIRKAFEKYSRSSRPSQVMEMDLDDCGKEIMRSAAGSAASGVIWSFLSQAVRLGSQVIGVMILARLLPASDFGLIAMASVVTGFAIMFRDFGTTAAVIQRPELTNPLLDSVFLFNIAMGLGLAVLVALFSPVVAWFFSEPRLLWVLLLLSLVFPLGALGLVQQALLERVSSRWH